MPSAITWFFTNRQTGRATILQPPNAPLAVFLVATAARLAVDPTGGLRTAITGIGTAALLVWAVLEIGRGDSPFRRVLGAIVLVITIAGILGR